MKCKSCKKEIPDGSAFCNFCGKPVHARRNKKREVIVPKPKQLASGDWGAQVMRDGSRSFITGSTEAEYRDKAIAYKLGLSGSKKIVSNFTVAEAIDKYIDSKKNRLQERSKEQYKYIKNKRFTELMQMRLSDVDSAAVDSAIEAELDKPSRKGGTLKPKTVIDAYHLVATVLKKYVVGIKLDVTLPELQRSLTVVVPPEDIYPVIKGTDIELPCLLAMWLGMSMSEIRGLTKSKSIHGDKLFIVETVVDLNSGPFRKDLAKEVDRRRVYDIPPYLKHLIDSVPGDVIEPRSGHAIYMRFQKELEGSGLPKMKFHALRHVNASVMAQESIPTIVAQARNGWKTDDTMKKTYFHTFDSERLAADKVIDDRFNKIVGYKPEKTDEK